MNRVRPLVLSALLSGIVAAPAAVSAQARPQPAWLKGHKLRVKFDSTPQQAAIYIDSKDYGIQGYTPSQFKLPKGTYKVILELQGWKTEEQILTITRSQAYAFTLVRQARPAILDVRAGTDQSALGGIITVDGAQVGSVPNQVEVAAGSHLLEVKRPGFHDYRDTLSVSEGERRTVVVTLVAQVKPGSILVTADVGGADVYVDGVRRDSVPALIGDLTEGDHTVEVRKEGATPWKQLVRVVGGQQTKVVAALAPAAPAVAAVGSLKVLSSTPMADVVVDGDFKGPVNSEIKDVRPGGHIVEVRAKGYEAKRVEVEVRAGELRVIPIDLAPEKLVKQTASLRVISPVPDAEVFLDGSSVGKAPVDREGLSPGKHFVVVHKDGYADYKVEIDLEPGKTFQVSANLHASGSIRAISNPGGADLYVDGTPVGKTPITLPDVPVGDHVVELKLADFLDAKQTVRVSGGQQQIMQVDLTPVHKGPTIGELERRQREQSSWGALTVDRFKFNIDVGVGHPYFANLRVITGIFQIGKLGADIGIELRTNIYQTDVGIRPRVQILRADPFALGADVTLVGGAGPDKRDSFTFELGAIFTLIAGSYVHVTFRPYLSVATDRLCPSVGNIQDDDRQNGTKDAMGRVVPGSGPLYGRYNAMGTFSGNYAGAERQICKAFDVERSRQPNAYQLPGPMPANQMFPGCMNSPGCYAEQNGQPDPRERFTTTRLMLQGVLEVAVAQKLTLWLLVEGAPAQPQRQAFTKKFNDVFPGNDFPFYMRAGLTGKF